MIPTPEPSELESAPFRVTLPDAPGGSFVFASPHSGSVYPADMDGAALSEQSLRSAEDALVDRLTVTDALDRLGPPADEILRLVYTEDLPYREVAERMGMPVGTVKSHVHRGLARLRERLEVRDD